MARRRSRVLRTVNQTRAAAGGAAATSGCLVLAVVGGRGAVIGMIFAPMWLLVTLRMARMGAYVRPDGVKVVGDLRTKRVAWQDIERFAALPAGQSPFVGHVLRTEGREPVVITAIRTSAGRTEEHRMQAQAQIDPLNEALARWRQAHADPGA